MPANEKYLPNESSDFIEEIFRRNAALEKRIVDLERQTWNADTPPALPRIDPTAYPDPYEGQRAIDVADEQHTWYSDGEWRKAASTGSAIYAIEVFENTTPIVVGDDIFNWEIPEDLDGATLLKVEGYVNTVSSSGSVQIQIAKLGSDGLGSPVDLLTNKVTIEASELNSRTAATQPTVVTTGDEDVVWGDHFRIDIDNAGTGVLGLGLILYFVPLATKTLAIQGAKGDPGGIANWTGQWSSSTTYTTGQAVSNNGSSYVAIQGSTNVEPGVTSGWEAYWMVLFDGQQYTSCTINVFGQGFLLDVGQKAIVEVPFPATIVGWTVVADQVGDIEFDIWKKPYGSYPPTISDSIVASAPPQLISAQKAQDTSLTGWTTSIADGDLLWVSVTSVTYIRLVSLNLKLARI